MARVFASDNSLNLMRALVALKDADLSSSGCGDRVGDDPVPPAAAGPERPCFIVPPESEIAKTKLAKRVGLLSELARAPRARVRGAKVVLQRSWYGLRRTISVPALPPNGAQ